MSYISTLHLGQIKTLEVSNVSLVVSEEDIKEFFSFSGEIQYVEMRRSALLNNIAMYLFIAAILRKHDCIFCSESDTTQLVYVTFKDSQGADTALLLSVSSSRMVVKFNHYYLKPLSTIYPKAECCIMRVFQNVSRYSNTPLHQKKKKMRKLQK